MIKELDKKPSICIIKPGLEIKKGVFIYVPYDPDLSVDLRRIFYYANVQVIFKGNNNITSILMHPKDKVPLHLKQNVVYKWPCSEGNHYLFNIGESDRCLKIREQ